MISKRQKIAASAASLVAGAGLALILTSGSAGASAPHTSPATRPTGAAITTSAAPGAVELDPTGPRPTLTISATPAPGGSEYAPDPDVLTIDVKPGASVPMDPTESPTATVHATTAAPSTAPSTR